MSEKSRNRTFWAGSKTNGNTFRAQARRAQDELNCKMAITRIKARYEELKGRQA
jgi:hypothetical protein